MKRVLITSLFCAAALDVHAEFEIDDTHLSRTRAVGVWTKADSTTAFDDFSYGTQAAAPK